MPNAKRVSRRDFNKLAASTAAVGPFFLLSGRARAAQKTLKIAKWSHFVPQFDPWFDKTAKDWGHQHGTQVTVENIPAEKISAVAAAEVKAGRGHDVFIFPWPPAEFYQHAIDHTEIYQHVAGK